MTASKRSVDFTNGPLFFKILLYTLPIMATGLLQHLYNMADNIVVGKFSGDVNALGAVGCTSAITALVINTMIAMSSGTAVLVSQSYGAKDNDTLSKAVHTSITFSLVIGVALSILGVFIARPGLILLNTDKTLLDSATLYMQIICLGIPANAVYNFGAAILRSVGDSKSPLLILSLAGLLNVVLNLVFVIVFKMTVDGVALATIISQYASAVAVVAILIKRNGESYAFKPRAMGINKPVLSRILRLGIPAAVQSSFFSISNIFIQSAVNTFPPEVVSAKTIATNIENTVYVLTNSFFHAAMTFTGQNLGAGKPERIKRVVLFTEMQVVLIGATLGQIILIFCEPIASLYIDARDPNRLAVLSSAIDQMNLLLPLYFICGVMEALSGALRGLGYSMLSMGICIVGACGLRVLWILTFFKLEPLHNIVGIYLCYPISWGITAAAMAIALVIVLKKVKKKIHPEAIAQ